MVFSKWKIRLLTLFLAFLLMLLPNFTVLADMEMNYRYLTVQFFSVGSVSLPIQVFYVILILISIIVLILLLKFVISNRNNRLLGNISKGFLNYGNRYVIMWKNDYTYAEVNTLFMKSFGLNREILDPKLPGCFGIDVDYKSGDNKFKAEILNGMPVLTVLKDINGLTREISWISMEISRKGKEMTVLSIGSDVTEKNSLKRELKLSDERCQIVMEAAEIAMIFIEKDGFVSYLSQVGAEILGIDLDIELNISQICERIHPSDTDLFESMMNSCYNNESKTALCEVRVFGLKGKFRWIMFKFKRIINHITSEQCIAGAFYDINDDKEKDLRIEKLAFQDDLTGIYNRKKFLSIVEETLSRVQNNNERYAIITINLNKFHRFNDLYGVEVGDKILKAVAGIIKYNPYGHGSICARLGNDEFASLIKLEKEGDRLSEHIKELSTKIENYSSSQYDDMKLSISVGACIFPDNVSDFHEVFERSIFSMRIAKEDPNNIYQEFDENIKEIILNKEILEKELMDAVVKKEFELYYQPKFDIETEVVVGAEALIRWNHPSKGIISPMKFIPLAEEIGVIGEIGTWTLMTACQQNVDWQKAGFDSIKISVNISSIEFYQSDIVSIVKNTLNVTGLEAKWLEIELTESMALVDVDETIRKMNELRAIGVGISMDDFGTGYSSLSYIQNLPIDELKLDKSFIDKIALDSTTKNITNAVITLAKIIGLVVVAEGVEEPEQFDLLKMMNCNTVQGYLFSKPVKAENITQFLKPAIKPIEK